jgi:hypothetical protein
MPSVGKLRTQWPLDMRARPPGRLEPVVSWGEAGARANCCRSRRKSKKSKCWCQLSEGSLRSQ